MIKYRVNNKFVDKNTFYEELKRMYDETPRTFIYNKCLDHLTTDGYIWLQANKRKSYMYDYFYVADEQVFELEQIIEENEYDALDGDAFAVAFAIYQHGFRKQ